MNTVEQSDEFKAWLLALTDTMAKLAVLDRIDRAEGGNFGKQKAVGGGVIEMIFDLGPGYRIYYARTGTTIYMLLKAGDKSTQQVDIARAQAMAAELKEEAKAKKPAGSARKKRK